MTPPAEPAIAPLARRLAEENAVAWRALKGSGPGGGVNERDVLGHLEAVMLGHPPAPKPRPAHTEPLGDAPWAAELALPIAPPPLTPVQTFEAEYRAALADLEALRAEVVRLQAEEERGRAEGRELGELRETVKTQADALAKARALEAQVGELRGALADAQRETRRAQEHGFDLAARLNKLNDAHAKAEAEAKRLTEANAGLEQDLARLCSRPWWRFWG